MQTFPLLQSRSQRLVGNEETSFVKQNIEQGTFPNRVWEREDIPFPKRKGSGGVSYRIPRFFFSMRTWTSTEAAQSGQTYRFVVSLKSGSWVW
jgi:hypothetical protein